MNKIIYYIAKLFNRVTINTDVNVALRLYGRFSLKNVSTDIVQPEMTYDTVETLHILLSRHSVLFGNRVLYYTRVAEASIIVGQSKRIIIDQKNLLLLLREVSIELNRSSDSLRQYIITIKDLINLVEHWTSEFEDLHILTAGNGININIYDYNGRSFHNILKDINYELLENERSVMFCR